MSTPGEAPGYRDIQRIRTAVDRIARLGELVEATLRAADGPEWMAELRGRLQQRRIRVRKDQGLHDPRVLLACIAYEDALAGVFSEEERAMAARLRQLANAAFHSDLGSVAAGDATWAEMSVDRLIVVGRAALPPRAPTGLDVQRWMRRAHEAARAEDAQRALASRTALQRREDYFERAWWLERSTATFRRLMAEAGNPGAERVRRRRRDLLRHPTPSLRGWTLAYRKALDDRDQPRELRFVLDTDGALWLCGTTRDGGIARVEQAVHLDPRRPRTYVVEPGWVVDAGEEEYVGGDVSRAIPFRVGWRADPEHRRSRSLEEAAAARIGELCFAHGLTWPDDDGEAVEELAQARVALLRDPPPVEVPSFALRRALATVARVLERLPRLPSWLAVPLIVASVIATPALAAILAIIGVGGLSGRFIAFVRDPRRRMRRLLQWRPRRLSVYVRDVVLFFITSYVLLLVLQAAEGWF